MVINVSVQYNGRLLPDIILLTLCDSIGEPYIQSMFPPKPFDVRNSSFFFFLCPVFVVVDGGGLTADWASTGVVINQDCSWQLKGEMEFSISPFALEKSVSQVRSFRPASGRSFSISGLNLMEQWITSKFFTIIF